MSDWTRVLAELARRADAWSDRSRERRRAGRRSRRTAHIVPYLGFGTAERLQITGRVLWGAPPRPASADDRSLQNLTQFYRRMASDEVPGARLSVQHGDLRQEVVADDEGYFQAELEPSPPLDASESGLHAIELTLLHPTPGADPGAAEASLQGLVMVPAPGARLGIVSDIDDTVVQTHVRSPLKMLLTLARSNAQTRQPFAGVAALYRALQAGAGGDEGNPVFYVSSSPWNLYAPLVEYLQAQGIPLGPLLLKDYGDHTLFALRDHVTHKQASIERIFETYPQLPFVLIGDSAEQDPEIYAGIVRRHPGRVKAIYIRAVEPDPARLAAIAALAEQVRGTGTQLVLAADSVAAAVHAAGEGLIAASALPSVQAGGQAPAAADEQADGQAAESAA